MKLFDLHCDTIGECYLQKQELFENRLHLDLKRGAGFSAWSQCFAIWIPDELRGQAALDYFKAVSQTYMAESEKNKLRLSRCLQSGDITEAEQAGKCAALLTVEGGGILAGNLNNIPFLQSCGVRMLTLTWNGSCEIGDGAMVEHPKGLTAFGRQAIPALEAHGIVIDVSHASEPLFYDVAEIAQKPLIASHSNAKGVCGHPRNLTNAQIAEICKRDGLIGLNFYPLFLTERTTATTEDIVRHAEYMLAMGAQNALALGSDFDGAELPKDMTGIESMGVLFERFLQLGYSESLVNAIFYENAHKFFVSL